MIAVIILSVISIFFWIMTAFTLKGVDWILINGVNLLPNEGKQEFRKKYDVFAINKYIGKNVFLPIAVICSLIVPLIYFDNEWLQSQPALFGIAITIISISFVVYLVRAAIKILDFEKWKK